MKRFLPLLILMLSLSISISNAADDKMAAEQTYDDIKKTLGIVPDFLKDYPNGAISGAWGDMKAIQLNPNTETSGKLKELIGLAVSAQIPCHYCVYFHTQAAKLNGANDREINEALAMSGSVRRWSTILHGSQINEQEFRSEVDKIVGQPSKPKQAMEEKPAQEQMKLTTAEDAYKDMERTLGFTPNFMKAYPQNAIVSAWQEMKGLEMNPNAVLAMKDRDLIGLAVAAQVPCPYCIYYHSQFAKAHGATEQQLKETIAMAGITRNWSTFLNGKAYDDQKFRNQTNQIMKHLKAKSKEVTFAK